MEIAWNHSVMQRRQAGFTLVELMIAVAIVGILSGIAVYAYQKVNTSAAIESEINAIFAEFRVRQEEYHAENGEYLSTGSGETDFFPTGGPKTSSEAPTDITPLLGAVDGTGGTQADRWVNLRMSPRKNQLRCVYVSIAGGPGDSPGATAGSFGMSGPLQTNWYYLIAECDSDGDGTRARYFARFDVEGVAVQNKGE